MDAWNSFARLLWAGWHDWDGSDRDHWTLVRSSQRAVGAIESLAAP